jgi:signal transduction histidine kinase
MIGLDRASTVTSLHDLPQPIAQLLQATLKDSEPRSQVETAIQAKSGDVLPVICSTSPLRDNAGTVLGAVAVLSDLTRLKTLEGEKQQAERLASIGALASGIAHEISNPLVAIKTFAELLPERFSEDDFRNDFASVVTREIERIDGLVSRLRAFARPTTRPFTDLDLRRPLEETLALLRGQLERSQIGVKLVLPARLPLVRGDASQLEQLFLNVIVNALEAMPPRGQLAIRARSRHNDGKETVLVEISDTGCGIPDGLLEKIFDPFLTTKQRGSGIGLSICRSIADAHRATMSAHNNADGRGATILIEFPVSDEIVAIVG